MLWNRNLWISAEGEASVCLSACKNTKKFEGIAGFEVLLVAGMKMPVVWLPPTFQTNIMPLSSRHSSSLLILVSFITLSHILLLSLSFICATYYVISQTATAWSSECVMISSALVNCPYASSSAFLMYIRSECKQQLNYQTGSHITHVMQFLWHEGGH
jgi:hypothetical protein